MKKLIFLFFCYAPYLYAQHNHAWKVEIMPAFFQLKEQNFTDIVHQNIGFATNVQYRYTKNKNTYGSMLQISGVRPMGQFEFAAVSLAIGLELQAQYDRALDVAWADARCGVYLAAQYRLAFYPMWDESHLYWANFWGMGIQGSLQKKIRDKTRWYAEVQIPLLGFIARPETFREYKIENRAVDNILQINHDRTNFATLNRHAAVLLRTGLILPYSDRFGIRFFYTMQYAYMKSSYSKAFKQTIHGVGLAFDF